MRSSICFVAPACGRQHGGVGVSAERVSRHLSSEFDVRVLVPDPDLPPMTFEEDPPDACGRVRTRFWWRTSDPAAGQFLADVLLEVAERDRPAVACAFYAGDFAFPVVHAARLRGTRSALFARGNDIDLGIFSPGSFHLHHALVHADLVFAVSQEMVRKVRAFAPAVEPRRVGGGVDTRVFRATEAPAPAGSRAILGLFGDIKAKKGLDLLLGATDFDRFELRVVGRLREESAKQLHGFLTYRPELVPLVRCVPFQEDEVALAAQYSACDLVCIPSIHDGLPNVLLEAMSCGRVCVASAVGGAPDLIEHGRNGFLFRTRCPEDLSRALRDAGTYLRTGSSEIQAVARKTVEERASLAGERASYLEALGGLLKNS